MYQRQLSKQELALSVEERPQKSGARFTRAELKELFTLRLDTACDTADLLRPSDASWEVCLPV